MGMGLWELAAGCGLRLLPSRFQKDCSVQDGIYVLRKAHMRSTPSLRSFLNTAFEKVLMIV